VETLWQPDGKPLLAVSGYELNKETNVREGAVEAYTLADDGSLTLLAGRQDVAGVLDAKWAPFRAEDGAPVLGTANADGTFALLKLAGGDHPEWRDHASICLGDPDDPPIVLSLAWTGDGTSARAAASRRDGLVSIVARGEGGELEDQDSWLAHSYGPGVGAEAWIVGLGPHEGGVVAWTGGDDCKLKGWDVREAAAGPGPRRRRPTFTAELDAGVCSCQWHPSRPELVATGGYDGMLRVWDRRMIPASASGDDSLSAAETGGGVWRVKWRPDGGAAVLTASMRGGAHVFGWDGAALSPRHSTLAHGAESLTYGADWALLGGARDTAVTCSFYNRELRSWSCAREDGGAAAGKE